MNGKKLFTMVWLFLAGVPLLHADATLLLEQPYGTFGAFNPTGHAAVYLSRVCAESPSRLRRCRPGELGAVISRYHRIAGKDWIAIPLLPYLYAVENPDDVPQFAGLETVAALRNNYRHKYLRSLAPDAPEGGPPSGEWTELVGASYDRAIYGFAFETSEQQDDALIEHLNSAPNKARFNLLFRNCADFAKGVINFYYPKAVRRSIVADAGITTPKQIAKSLVNFSRKNPELSTSTFMLPQVPGELRRSRPVRGVFESLLRSKKYALPLAVLYPWVAGGGGIAYLVRGRFNPTKHASAVYEAADLQQCMMSAEPGPACEKMPRDAAAETE
jgi:RES domain-containing protein